METTGGLTADLAHTLSLSSTHRFIRDDPSAEATYGEAVAKKYEDSLFKEYALCDLKHYKSGRVSSVPLVVLVFPDPVSSDSLSSLHLISSGFVDCASLAYTARGHLVPRLVHVRLPSMPVPQPNPRIASAAATANGEPSVALDLDLLSSSAPVHLTSFLFWLRSLSSRSLTPKTICPRQRSSRSCCATPDAGGSSFTARRIRTKRRGSEVSGIGVGRDRHAVVRQGTRTGGGRQRGERETEFESWNEWRCFVHLGVRVDACRWEEDGPEGPMEERRSRLVTNDTTCISQSWDSYAYQRTKKML